METEVTLKSSKKMSFLATFLCDVCARSLLTLIIAFHIIAPLYAMEFFMRLELKRGTTIVSHVPLTNASYFLVLLFCSVESLVIFR